jgi:hypothetical protein
MFIRLQPGDTKYSTAEGVTVLVLLVVAACCWKRRSAKNKNESGTDDLRPFASPTAPSRPAENKKGKYQSWRDYEQPHGEPSADTDATTIDVGTTEYSLPPTSAWAGLGGAAPSVDYRVSASADQNAALYSTTGSSVNPELLSSNYVTPPPLR